MADETCRRGTAIITAISTVISTLISKVISTVNYTVISTLYGDPIQCSCVCVTSMMIISTGPCVCNVYGN